jgi:hypothetical protein
MSRPSDPEGFDDRPGDGSGWQEPAHLGEGPADGPAPGEGASEEAAPAAWEPPGWSLPPARRESAAERSAELGISGGGWQASNDVIADPADLMGAHAWALQRGWTVSDGSGPQDAVLRKLIAAGPVRLGKEHRPAGVMRGRFGSLDVVAFDVVFPLGRRVQVDYAVTAAPLLGSVPRLRLSPARLWKHGTAGLLQIPSGDPEFDLRWVLLAAEDGPQVRRLVGDPTVRGLLLGSDDGDEFWTAAGHVAAVRSFAHRPQLIEHHGRLLTAIVGALSAAY